MTRCNTRWSASMMLVLLLPLLSGCKRQGKVEDDGLRARHRGFTAEADNEQATQAPVSLGGPFGGGTASPPHNRPTPPSTVALDVNMKDGDLVAYLNRLVYDLDVENGQLILASCIKNGNACGTTEKAAIYVQPEIGANQVDINTITEEGIVLARVINYDQDGRSSKAFGIPANARAWWVVRRKNDRLESLFLYRDFKPDPARPSVKLASRKTFGNCDGHVPHPDLPAIARWSDCDSVFPFHASVNTDPVSTRSYFRFVSNPPRAAAPLGAGDKARVNEGSVWITCSLGCCIAQ